MFRLKTQMERLEAYIAGGESIPELEEELLEYNGSGAVDEAREIPYLNTWAAAVSANII